MKSDTHDSLGMGAVYLTASKVVTLCVNLAVTMLLSRYWSKTEYGTFSQLLLVVNLFASIIMLGLPNSINYFVARAENAEERRRFLSVFYSLSTLLSLLLGGILAGSNRLIEAYFSNPLIRDCVFFLAVFPWASVITSGIENILVVFGKTRFLILYRFLNSLSLLAVVLLVSVFRLCFSAYLAIYLAVYALFAVLVYTVSSRLCGGIRIDFDRDWIHRILRFSIPLGLASAVGTLDVEIDKLLIGRMMDTEELAVYTNASKELPVTIVAISITAVLMPKLVALLKQNKKAEALSLWGNATELSVIAMALIVSGFFVFAEDILVFLYSEKYLTGLPVFRIYILVLLFRSTYLGIVLNSCGETKKIFYCSVASLLLNVVLNPLFYLMVGMVGPAIATLISIGIMAYAQLKLTSNYLSIPMKEIFPWRQLAQTLLVSGVFGAAFAWIKHLLPLEQYLYSLGESMLLGVVWAILYGIVMKKRIVSCWRVLHAN